MQVRKSSPAITTDVEILTARALPYKQEIIALLQSVAQPLPGKTKLNRARRLRRSLMLIALAI